MIERQRRVVIVTDAAADLPSVGELKTRFGVDPITEVSLGLTFGKDSFVVGVSDNKEYPSIDKDVFRERINREIESKSGVIPKTSASLEIDFDKAYEDPIKQGLDIVSIHISEKMSETISNAKRASQKIEGNRVSIFDSQTVSMAQGLMAIEAEKMAANGATKEEIIEMLTDMRERTTLRAVTPNFPFLKESGRVPMVKAIIGGVFKLIPIIGIDHITETSPVKQIATFRKDIKAVEWMEGYLTKDNIPEQLAIVDFGAKEISDKLAARLIKNGVLPEEKIYRGDLGPVTGSHGGPGTWAMITVRR